MQLRPCWVGLQFNRDDNLQSQLERMYQVEFSETKALSTTGMSIEDQRALSVMEISAKLVDGHYEIGLPWRYGIPNLPNNRSMAEQRLRLKKNSTLREKYRNIIDDHVEKGYASKINKAPTEKLLKDGEASSNDRLWYLSHPPILHP